MSVTPKQADDRNRQTVPASEALTCFTNLDKEPYMQHSTLRTICPDRAMVPIFWFVIGVFASCSTSGGSRAGEPHASEQRQTRGDKRWDDMSHEERMEVMKAEVMPRAKELFAALDPAEYADADCTLCHGAGAKEGKFAMPSSEPPSFKMTMFEDKPEISAFMKDKLVPLLAHATGKQPFDPATGEGDVKCVSCHPME
ncbi:MAG: hypothetical protein SF187_02190 [Deltaproteobacteria bacterium]|nr:hypothetical protein [Deltaproteobacteria bacterium]